MTKLRALPSFASFDGCVPSVLLVRAVSERKAPFQKIEGRQKRKGGTSRVTKGGGEEGEGFCTSVEKK